MTGSPTDGDGTTTRKHIIVYINGSRHELRDVEPSRTTLQQLRLLGLTGTKLGCGEGGCGACTVVVRRVDAFSSSSAVSEETISVNACLTPICALDACAVTTVEGLGTSQDPHPVQRRLAEFHGSQCGFCTPGIVMALYALIENGVSDVERHFDGNLCRCTGYRPILDAAKSMVDHGCPHTGGGSDDSKEYGCCRDEHEAKCAMGQGCCKNTTGDCCGDVEDCYDVVASCTATKVRGFGPVAPSGDASIDMDELMSLSRDRLAVAGKDATWHRPTSLVEVLSLKRAHPNARVVTGNTEVGIEHKFKHRRDAHLISVANVKEMQTVSFVSSSESSAAAPAVVSSSSSSSSEDEESSPEASTKRNDCLRVGGGASLTQLFEACQGRQEDDPACVAIRQMLKWFASTQIRNVASLAGNVATASPISDMNPLLLALGATLELVSLGEKGSKQTRTVSVSDFFKAYRVVDLRPEEVIVSVLIPLGNGASPSSSLTFVSPFKQAKRREDDISIVTSGMKVVLKPDLESMTWRVETFAAGFGGMAPTTVAAIKTAETLVGAEWSMETVLKATDVMARELALPENVPGGMSEYRQTLCASFLHKFYVQVCLDLDKRRDVQNDPPAPLVSSSDRSAADTFLNTDRPSTKGYQEWPRTWTTQSSSTNKEETANGTSSETSEAEKKKLIIDTRTPISESIAHRSALVQTTGEAKYVDDYWPKQGDDCLHAALVLTTIPKGRVKSVDATDALRAPGVITFVSAEDVKGSNKIGAIIDDEECFVTREVTSVGQPIGLIVAADQTLALDAARLVKVDYEASSSDDDDDAPACFSIDDAIRAESFVLPREGLATKSPRCIKTGLPFDEAVAKERAANASSLEEDQEEDPVVVVEGEVYVGGQEHFYLETNASICIPLEDGGMRILASTQNPTKTQMKTAAVLGVPASRVVCVTKRMGGGFGGKESRSVFLTCAVAVAARKVQRPVKLTLDRDVDMAITGQRHPFKGIYKAAARRKDGKIIAADVTLYSNAGYSLDLSESVMDRALFHCENAYKIPNLTCRGYVCRTNVASNTAFRGFGGPQGMHVCETYVTHLAGALGLSPEYLRERNLYSKGEVTHYDQKVDENVDLRRLWDRAMTEADVTKRRLEVDSYNAENKWRKRGLAVVPVMFGISFTAKLLNQGGALVHIYTDGSVLVSHGGTEMGQGLHTKVQQAVAKALGVDLNLVHVEETATDKVPNSSPSAASMSTDLYCMAALDACEQLVQRLQPVRRDLEQQQQQDPVTIKWRDLVVAAYVKRVNLSAQGFYVVPHDRCGYDFSKPIPEGANNAARGQPFNYFTSGVACSEVELDVLTGDAFARRVDIIMDLGAPINPAIDVGQIEGAFAQGYGLFCLEEMVWGDAAHKWVKPGHLHTRGPGAYKLPSANDTALDMRVILIDNPNEHAVHSSRAVGEPPLFLGASAFFAMKDAIASARRDAGLPNISSYEPIDSPLTPERARMACGDALAQRFAGGPHFRAKGSF